MIVLTLLLPPDFERTDTGLNRESFLTALREHVGRESPRLIRPKLEAFLDNVLNESLTPQVLENLLRDVFTQVLNTFPRKQKLPLKPQAKQSVAEAHTQSLDEPTSHQIDFGASTVSFDKEQCIDSADQTDWQQPVFAGDFGEGPSDFLPEQPDHVFGLLDDYNALDPQGLMDLLNFDDLRAETAAWLPQPAEASSHADSGYFSVQSEGDTQTDKKGKGKDAVRDPASGPCL